MAINKKAFTCLWLMMMLTILSKTDAKKRRKDLLENNRLPNNAIPRAYEIHLEVFMDPETLAWNGASSIELEIIDPTPKLTLHAYKNLQIVESDTELVNDHGEAIRPLEHYRNELLDFLELDFHRQIAVGNYTLNLRFSGDETCCSIGLFKHNIRNNRPIAATLFEPTGARRAFPCFDEPGLKARFQLSVEHHEHYTVVSNMPTTRSIPFPTGMIITAFVETPIMSTYLLNFVISDYEHFSNHYGNATVSTKLPAENVRYLLNLSPKVAEIMESYTGASFGLPRIGSVLLPFHPESATQHWGLVTYREKTVNDDKYLLTSARNDSAHLLVAHELSLSWFGNRVTPLWWDDLWLSEGFATYFQYYIMDKIFDNWGGIELFVLRNNFEGAFPSDTEKKIPIKTIPMTENEIIRQFDLSSFQKGAAIVHMFRHVLGDNVFRSGIQKYIARNSFKSVVTDDLIEALNEAYKESGNNGTKIYLKEMMYPWLENKGYPVLTVTRNYASGNFTLFQRSNNVNRRNDMWLIPFTFASQSNPNFTSTAPFGWVIEKKSRGKIIGVNKRDWIIANVQASGYYRVNYDDKNWNRLAKYLCTDDFKNIHVLNRAQLISDSFYLAQLEPDIYYYNFYNIIKYLSREDEYLPWRAAHYAITRIADSLPSGSEAHSLFQNYILKRMERFVGKVGFEPREDDDHYTKLSRMDIIKWACENGHNECADYAAKKIKEHAEDPTKNQLHPDTRSWVFCAGIRGLNGEEVLKFSTWAYVNLTDLLIDSIGCTKNHTVHRSVLYSSFMKNGVGDPRETSKIMRTLLASSEENFNYAIDFFIKYYAVLNETISNDEWYEINDILENIVLEVKTPEQLEKFSEIIKLEAIVDDPKVSQTEIFKVAEDNVEKYGVAVVRFLKCWDKMISTYNLLSDDFNIDFVPLTITD